MYYPEYLLSTGRVWYQPRIGHIPSETSVNVSSCVPGTDEHKDEYRRKDRVYGSKSLEKSSREDPIIEGVHGNDSRRITLFPSLKFLKKKKSDTES